jgi:hypothetical protein
MTRRMHSRKYKRRIFLLKLFDAFLFALLCTALVLSFLYLRPLMP